jgi:hypothetical protein
VNDKHIDQVQLIGSFKEELATENENNRQGIADLKAKIV